MTDAIQEPVLAVPLPVLLPEASGTEAFDFQGVTARVFPVKANMSRLNSFCENYLNNELPPSIAYFRPYMPYVYLMVLNYGRMSDQAIGYVAQREVTFTVPLEWYREIDGELVFQDWACVTPFIFVDDDISLGIGREVYGWPKVLASVDAEVNTWAGHPRSPERLLTLKTNVFPRILAGRRQQPRILMEVIKEPPPTISQIPPDLNNSLNLVTGLTKSLMSSISLTGELIDSLVRWPIRGFEPRPVPEALVDMLKRAGHLMGNAVLPELLFKILMAPDNRPGKGGMDLCLPNITLKQFRTPDSPWQACYQAIVASKLSFRRFNRGGLLGDMHLAQGDLSGGFRINIHRYAGQPIVDSLGLEIEEETRQPGLATDEQTVSVATLKPVLPFWTDVELSYGVGRVLGWRATRDGDAMNGWLTGHESLPAGVAGLAESRVNPELTRPSYNLARGGAIQTIAGPFDFPNAVLQVYPLEADHDRLAELCEEYLNNTLKDLGGDELRGVRFEPFGSYVYMIVTRYGDDIVGEFDNIGSWANREITFSVPVKWYVDGELASMGLFTPFVFADSGRAVATEREVSGRPALRAYIDSPPDTWLSGAGPVAARSLLSMKTEVYPIIGRGQRAERRLLLELHEATQLVSGVTPLERSERQDEDVERYAAQRIAGVIRATEQVRSNPRAYAEFQALALEPLINGIAMHEIILKQYPSAKQRGRACYQSLVKLSRRLGGVDSVKRIDRPVEVVIYRYPDPDIVKALGLKTVTVDYSDGLVKQYIEAQYPFWVKGGIEQQLGQTVCWRSGGSAWISDHDWLKRPGKWGKTPPYFRPGRHVSASRSLLVGIDEGGRADIDLIDHIRAVVDDNVHKSLDVLRQRLASLGPDTEITWADNDPKSGRWAELATLLGSKMEVDLGHAVPLPELLEFVQALGMALGERTRLDAPMTSERAAELVKVFDEPQMIVQTILNAPIRGQAGNMVQRSPFLLRGDALWIQLGRRDPTGYGYGPFEHIVGTPWVVVKESGGHSSSD